MEHLGLAKVRPHIGQLPLNFGDETDIIFDMSHIHQYDDFLLHPASYTDPVKDREIVSTDDTGEIQLRSYTLFRDTVVPTIEQLLNRQAQSLSTAGCSCTKTSRNTTSTTLDDIYEVNTGTSTISICYNCFQTRSNTKPESPFSRRSILLDVLEIIYDANSKWGNKVTPEALIYLLKDTEEFSATEMIQTLYLLDVRKIKSAATTSEGPFSFFKFNNQEEGFEANSVVLKTVIDTSAGYSRINLEKSFILIYGKSTSFQKKGLYFYSLLGQYDSASLNDSLKGVNATILLRRLTKFEVKNELVSNGLMLGRRTHSLKADLQRHAVLSKVNQKIFDLVPLFDSVKYTCLSKCFKLINTQLATQNEQDIMREFSNDLKEQCGPAVFKYFLQILSIVQEELKSYDYREKVTHAVCNKCMSVVLGQNLSKLFMLITKRMDIAKLKRLFPVDSSTVEFHRHYINGAYETIEKNITTVEGLLLSPFFNKLSEARRFSILQSILPEGLDSLVNLRSAMEITDTVMGLNKIAKLNQIDKCYEMLKGKDIRTIKKLHDEIAIIIIMLETPLKKINPHYYEFLQGKEEVPGTDFVLVAPKTNIDIKQWGKTQRHCIGTYDSNMMKLSSMGLGVWDKSIEEWFGHIMFEPFFDKRFYGTDDLQEKLRWVKYRECIPGQFYGAGNSTLPRELRDRVTRHITRCIAEYLDELQTHTVETAVPESRVRRSSSSVVYNPPF